MATFDPAAFAQQLEALKAAGASFDELSSKLRTLNAEQAEQVLTYHQQCRHSNQQGDA